MDALAALKFVVRKAVDINPPKLGVDVGYFVHTQSLQGAEMPLLEFLQRGRFES